MKHMPRFKANPVEVFILAGITVIFCSSLYDLLYNHSNLQPAALKPMTAIPTSEGNNRAPASVSQAFQSVELPCEKAQNERITQASKIRILGAPCKEEANNEFRIVPDAKTRIFNESNHYSATVFEESTTGKFSTDYIPLIAGKNTIHIEVTHPDGQIENKEVIFNKTTDLVSDLR